MAADETATVPPVYRAATVVRATTRITFTHPTSVFLAGTTARTDGHDWREILTEDLARYPVTILNPYQPKWDNTWREDISDDRFREQVEWEMDMQDAANIIAFFFHPASQASISLLELGLAARSGKAVVVGCPEGYWKRGNVQVLCNRFGIRLVHSESVFRREVRQKVVEMLVRQQSQRTTSASSSHQPDTTLPAPAGKSTNPDFLRRAIEQVKVAIEADNSGKYEKAYQEYYRSLEFFMMALKWEQNSASKEMIRQKTAEYLNRAEKLKEHLILVDAKGKEPAMVYTKSSSDFLGRAIDQVRKAAEADSSAQYDKAFQMYVQSIKLFLQASESETSAEAKEEIEKQAEGYKDRVEKLKDQFSAADVTRLLAEIGEPDFFDTHGSPKG